MNKDEILKMSREENEGRRDEYEMMAYGTASRVGMLVGAIICAVLVFASELIFHIPEIGLVGWLVYCSMQGSGSIVLYQKLKNRRNLIWGIIEIAFAVAFAVGLNCPVSMELIVLRDTPTISASCCCDKPFSLRHSLRLFFNINFSFIVTLRF